MSHSRIQIIEVIIAAPILPVAYKVDYVGSKALLKSSQQNKRRSLNEQSSSNLCSICWSGISQDDFIVFWPGCDHPFHKACVKPWRTGHPDRTCPICRAPDTEHPETPIPTPVQTAAQPRVQNYQIDPFFRPRRSDKCSRCSRICGADSYTSDSTTFFCRNCFHYWLRYHN
ncbi:hypothetical protein PGT21_025010 [Puccinia graminis f. sp. tritici]|uniref:RING-type domain-containing protein n=1 Tax=Puccinia graminis f. sp. tritici TaxID=56615 RepID=A0A5B0QNT3_PUCGR|nr:hypothetical protein PGT21_025010 [Puccinia graminis f. sp. tritici]